MGLFSWLSGKPTDQPPAEDDNFTLASKIATVLDYEMFATDGDTESLFEPNCCVVLTRNRQVKLIWFTEETKHQFKDVLMYAMLSELPSMETLKNSLRSALRLQKSIPLSSWRETSGHMLIDRVAMDALRRMKANAQDALNRGEA